MSDIVAEPLREVHLDEPVLTKFARERRAFYQLLPDLLKQYRGQYAAIHEEQVVDVGPERLAVALRVLDKIGNQDIFVGLVDTKPEPPSRSGVLRVSDEAGRG